MKNILKKYINSLLTSTINNTSIANSAKVIPLVADNKIENNEYVNTKSKWSKDILEKVLNVVERLK